MILLQRPLLAEPGQDGTHRPQPGASQMRNPKPFTVYHTIRGQNPKPLFVIHAYSIEQPKAQVAAKVAGETIVFPVKEATSSFRAVTA
jgi:hypothetical protein